jgi:transposase InsO family protein
MDDVDPELDKALMRYEVISAYLAMDPPRGQRRPLLKKLASRIWTGSDGEPLRVSAETIRVWVRRYRKKGLDGLRDKPRPQRGCQALTAEQAELAVRLKREVPERSLDRLITIMEDMKLVEPDVVKRSTLHRVLQSAGVSRLRGRVPDRQDLDRFEADAPNALWQSDMLTGPWLPDPERPGKMRRAYLYAFLDDHSRLLLHGRFSFKGDLPALELVFRRCLQKYGVCVRVYYDNGQTYRSRHMRQIVAILGIHPIIFTKTYRPMGHGKIEKLNELIRAAFLAELKASNITTLDQLNEAFGAWADLHYNRKVHGETGEAPLDRWRAGIERIQYADEEKLRQAFLWREKRTTDKAGVFSLFGVKYQVSAGLARRRIELLYDPEQLDLIEVWRKGVFRERVKPFAVRRHRRPKARVEKTAEPQTEPAAPAADWLGHLVEQRREQGFIEPSPRQLAEQAVARRAEADEAIVDLLAETLDEAVFDEAAIRDYLERYGPFDVERAQAVLERMLADGGRPDHHVTLYLDAIRNHHGGERT